LQQGKKEKTGKFEYTLPDRVLDGISIVINHIHVTFALNGRFRNAKKGLWYITLSALFSPYAARTPHILDINIYDFELYSTNEKWEKGIFLAATY
jgi:hypothetical protein